MWQVRSATRPRRYRGWLTPFALVPALALGLGACSTDAAPLPPQVLADKGSPFAELMVPTFQASVTEGAVGVRVDQPIAVTASNGVLGSVTVQKSDGTTVAGELSPDGLTWRTTEKLGYDKQYKLKAEALGLGGVARSEVSFQTYSPDGLTMAYPLPNNGDTVGVGQPVAIRFDENIPNRVAAERAITVTANPPVEGAFYWLNNREVRWRPAQYWKPGTTVDVAVKIYGADLGTGLSGQEDVATRFTIGDAVIATVDDNTKTVTVRVNGEVVKTMPTSMGKNSTPTSNGTYLVGDRFSHIVMDSSTYGVPVNSPNGYRTDVDWATQISYSGIFVHSAPWSVGSQGYTNVSHGCLNVSPSNAVWFFNNTKRGDVVEIVNTVGSTLSGTDGLGDWNIPWPEWRAGNAAA